MRQPRYVPAQRKAATDGEEKELREILRESDEQTREFFKEREDEKSVAHQKKAATS
jgi:hypothetical protein